ncbi:MAG: oxidoreductase [Owenweeksia sp.]|nr:oxidoreductase [Owenweeksia sp.]|tara:strand:+ start:185 stop:1204 length:1020 start_codon:yes stop_codon:yes gene_type:complete
MKYILISLAVLAICEGIKAQPYWENFETSSEASLRGLHAISAKVCWASGSEGTVLRTRDGGKTWEDVSVPASQELQFRDIHAFGADTALVLSAGLPALIYYTSDGGKNWLRTYENNDAGIFFDAMDFWDQQRGIAFSDAPGNRLVLIETQDGGKSWQHLPESTLPKVATGQGGFAASGTCLRTLGPGKVIIGLGGPEATVLLSEDYGRTWYKTSAPLDHGEASKGIFSFAFRNEKEGFCTGGDYRADSLTGFNIARTTDGGRSWFVSGDETILGRYRSCIAYLNKDTLLTVSRNSGNYSLDAGESWNELEGGFYTISVAKDGAAWASGPAGSIALLHFP